jgi:zinc protease
MHFFSRVPRFAILALAGLAAALPANAQTVQAQTVQPQPTAGRQVQTGDDPWLYKNSDLVHDDEWKFGRLSNGLRYAVRKNGVPPGQVSVRVRMDVGSLMERDSERGFAHLLEHLSFRGSVHVPDGESKRIWQRLGVTFGSDSNASTTFTATTYKLDLPMATPAGLDESFKILAGMMSGPQITQPILNSERPVVLAEQREQPGPQVRLQDAMLDLMFAGQPLAQREPIGTVETLTGATPESVQAFHDRWYRPERATVIAIGDVDPALLEQMIVKHFSDWRGTGAAEPSPDFGKPVEGKPVSASIVEPALPVLTTMAIVRPWTVFADTVIFNQKRMIDLVAIRIINRRLETKARSGGATFLAAGADLSDLARSANITTVQVLPIGDNWEAALKDVRGVIADAQATPPTQAEIDRELAEIESAMLQRINTAPVEAGAKLADDLADAVDINETVTTPLFSYSIFKTAVQAKMFTPAAVLASSRKVFEGTATRAMVNLHAPDPTIGAKISAALSANVAASGKRKLVGAVSFAQLPRLGVPGKIAARESILPGTEIEKLEFANGVRLLVRQDPSETGKVYVNVRFGRGLAGLNGKVQTPAWTEGALVSSGVGKYGQEELDALTGSRQIGMDFDVDDDAFTLKAQTTKSDLPDQLKLLAAKLAAPAWDPNPVERAKVAALSSYAALSSSPDQVLNRDLERLLHGGDPRWGLPDEASIKALTPASFRAFWAPILASGPIEVEVFGDMDKEATVNAVAATFGALKPRPASAAAATPVRFPAHVATPVTLTHKGQDNQAAAVIAWPTGGGSAGIAESRRLEVLAAIFRDRLIDQLRSQAGVSYSPQVASQWPLGLPSGGRILAIGLVPPDKTPFFFTLSRGIAADLVAKPVDADELNRALTPLKQQILRMSSGNMFWMRLVEGGTYDPARIAGVETLAQDYARVTPADIQALAVKYLQPDKDWALQVLPEKK